MKKLFKKIALALLSAVAITSVFAYNVYALEQYSYEGSVVYLSDNGSDTNDGATPQTPVATHIKAATLGGAGCTVVVTDKYTYKSGNGAIPRCTVAGLNENSVIDIETWDMPLSGDVVVKNITLNALKSWSFILAHGNSFTADENVKITHGDEATNNLSIRGGGENTAVDGDTYIVLKSGKWQSVYAGTKGSNVSGSTFVTIYDTASVESLSSGNDSANSETGVLGDGIIKLVGSKKNITLFKTKPQDVAGNIYIDITEYSGETEKSWEESGAIVINDFEQFPDKIKDKYTEIYGEYDLSAIENLVYLSDSGNDSNDGKSKDKPFKTLNAAQDALGEKGGTVAITGTYTFLGNTVPKGPLNITSTCKNDTFVWSYWALETYYSEIYNLRILVNKDWGFFLHNGTPLKFGENVVMELGAGIKYHIGIRAAEFGDKAMTYITINSGTFNGVFAGTKNANLNGDATITVNGGTIQNISCGNDSTTGRILGNVNVILRGKANVLNINDKKQYDGYALVDISELEANKPTIAQTLTVITEKNNSVIPINSSAIFIYGYPDNTFLPDKVMTRAEAVAVVARLCGLNDNTKVPETTAFADVTENDWYAVNVKYLESLGMLEFLGTEFSAEKGITRAEFVKLISGIFVKKDIETPSFSDVPQNHEYFDEIVEAAKAGIVTGYPDGTFLPENTLKRAEIATILNRIAKRSVVEYNVKDIEKFSDINGHWAQYQIIAASSEPYDGDKIIWYSGDKYSENSPVNIDELNFKTTEAVLKDIDVENSESVANAVETYAEKRRKEIAATETSVEIKGVKYYVSNDGNDSNDGKSPEKPWKTLDKVNTAALSAGDGVLFNRGDIFRGQLKTQKGVTYSAYGSGEKPKLYGSLRNYSESAFWDKTDIANVYVSKEAFSKDVGLIVFNNGEAWTDKQIIGIKGFQGTLTADLQMYHNTTDNKLYLYSVSDPNQRFSSTEIAQGQHGITGDGNGVTIDNLCIKYVGAHGIGYGDGTTGLTVKNCELGWIGGMIQKPQDGTRYGNAVEIYVSAKDYVVENCHIYQIYDAGVTHQWFSTRDQYVNIENVRYSNNVIEYCTYNIEYCNQQPEDKGIMKNIEISGNLLIHGGEGWGAQRPSRGDAAIQGWFTTNYSENFVIFDNVVMTMDSNCRLANFGVERVVSVPAIIGNLFVGKRGNYFGVYGLKNSIYQPFDEGLLARTVGLENNTFVICE